MISESIKNIQQQLLQVSSRFALVLVGCVFYYFLILADYKMAHFDLNPTTCERIFIAGSLWLIAWRLFTEGKQLSQYYYYGIGIPVLLLLATYLTSVPILEYEYVFMRSSGWIIFLLNAALILSVMVAPFVFSKATDEQIGRFNYRICQEFIWAFVVSLALYVSLYVGVLALGVILSLIFHIDGNSVEVLATLYDIIWPFIVYIIFPVIILKGIPTSFTQKSVSENEGFVDYILAYLLVPFPIYATIGLYCYIVKNIIQGSLLNGDIAFTVITVGLISVVAYLASYFCSQNQTAMMNWFRKHLFKLLFPPLLLIAVATGMGVYQEGITEDRYVTLLFSLWLITCLLYSLQTRFKRQTQFTYLTAIFLFVLSSFGPWNVVNLSTYSQVSRLQNILSQNQILLNGLVVVPHKKVDKADEVKISRLLDYFVDTRKNANLHPWFAQMPTAVLNNTPPKSAPARDVAHDLGIKYFDAYTPERRGKRD